MLKQKLNLFISFISANVTGYAECFLKFNKAETEYSAHRLTAILQMLLVNQSCKTQ